MKPLRTLLLFFIVSHLGISLIVLPLSLLLLFVAETVRGQIMGGSMLFLGVGIALLWFLYFPKLRTRIAIATLTCLLLAVVGLGWAFHLVPDNQAPQSPKLSQFYPQPGYFSRYRLTRLVPEIDQLKLGTFLMPLIDPVIDGEQAKRIRKLFVDVYTDSLEDPDFKQSDTALGQCYQEILSGSPSFSHFYEYIPRQMKKKSYPVLIFTHGSLGNFKAYTWILKSLADSEGFAIIAPSYGCGNWQLDLKSDVLNAIYDYSLKTPVLDQDNLYLVGISNGGMGVTREILNHGNRYQGYILISPVMEIDVVTDSDFIRHAKGKPVFMIHGEEDRRIPLDYVLNRESILQRNGALVDSRYYPHEDHFLFFSKRNLLVKDLAHWLNHSVSKVGVKRAASNR